jgi:8-oxo-dGTP pyrophosphatase MutT (NUDIX family)
MVHEKPNRRGALRGAPVTRPGWGSRHPELTTVLTRAEPLSSADAVWIKGTLPLRITAYRGVPELPDELVTSVRCIVRVADRIVVCTNVDGIAHAWPGGRREPGESLEQTATREVHEETGWLLDRGSFRLLGWLHLEHVRPVPADYPWPHPDFCQLVGTADAHDRDGGVDADWSDTEGYEASSELMSVDDAMAGVRGDPLSRCFLAAARRLKSWSCGGDDIVVAQHDGCPNDRSIPFLLKWKGASASLSSGSTSRSGSCPTAQLHVTMSS